MERKRNVSRVRICVYRCWFDLILIYFHWPPPFIHERMYESFLNVQFSHDSFFAMFNFSKGPMKWERVPSEREKTCHSKAWFTVKKDTIHIKTKTFSFWSVLCCGGPKRKRATVFVSKPNPGRNLLHLRFYIYSDNEDSRKVWSGVIVRSVYHIQGKTTKFHLNRDGLYQKRTERNGLQGGRISAAILTGGPEFDSQVWPQWLQILLSTFFPSV